MSQFCSLSDFLLSLAGVTIILMKMRLKGRNRNGSAYLTFLKCLPTPFSFTIVIVASNCSK